jgi:hypothetical protein
MEYSKLMWRLETTSSWVPPNPEAFTPPLKSTVFAQFDVPNSQLNIHDLGNGWGRVWGPASLEAKLAARKGLPVPVAMPPAINIRDATPPAPPPPPTKD